jgi:hypothetical protein
MATHEHTGDANGWWKKLMVLLNMQTNATLKKMSGQDMKKMKT